MMKKAVLLSILLLLTSNLIRAQITYGTSEMPIPGDTFRISITAATGGVDYTLTGNNYTWDFSNLTHPAQNIDTFVTVTSVPAIYQLIFNSIVYPNNRATVAMHQTNSPIPIPNLQIHDVYNFYRNTSSFYAQVGYGANISGSNLPVRLVNVDYIYRFPLNQGNIDSCISDFGSSIPGIGYFGETKKRKNKVDGWGTLITPYGTFQTIRVKSELYIHDTLYYNSVGYAQDRTETEYKWLANGFGIPVLTVINRQTGLYVEYIDSIRPNILNTKHDLIQNNLEWNIFPNPCTDFFIINYSLKEKTAVNISLFNIQGEKIITLSETEQLKGTNSVYINLTETRLTKGIYYVRLTLNSRIYTKKVIIN